MHCSAVGGRQYGGGLVRRTYSLRPRQPLLAKRFTLWRGRQLRLYAYLCSENEYAVNRGIIVRSDGRQQTLDIPAASAAQEADKARLELHNYNEAARRGSFAALANPSPTICRSCICLPLCESFWQSARPDWALEVGGCCERTIQKRTSIDSESTLITLQIRATRGTYAQSVVHTKPLPTWTSEADGSLPAEEGELVRLVSPSATSIQPQTETIGGPAVKIWRVQHQ